MARTSAVPGFYKLSPAERLQIVCDFAGLSDVEAAALGGFGALGGETANRMIENVIGSFPLPLGVAANFKVNGEELFVPMALEEPSVVAAASHMAKGTLPAGIAAETDDPVMIGQIQLVDLDDAFAAKATVEAAADEIVALANEQDPILVKFGGGCRGIEVRVLDSAAGPMVITHLLVDCRDAMGANAVNTMAEAVAPRLETLTGGRVYLRIISNLAVHRKVRASATWPSEFLGGGEVHLIPSFVAPERRAAVLVEQVDPGVYRASGDVLPVRRDGYRFHIIPGSVVPERRAAVLVEQVDPGVYSASGDVLPVRRDGDRPHSAPSGVAPERRTAVLVEQVNLVVTGTGGDVLPVRRDGNRVHNIPGGVAPEWGAAVPVEEVDLVGAGGDVLPVRRDRD